MWKNRKIRDLSYFERGQIAGARIAGASVTKITTLLSVSRATVSKVTSACTNQWKTTSTKRNSGQKSTLTGRDHRTLRRIVSKNHTTTAAQVTRQQDPVSTKFSDVSFTKPTSMVAAGLQVRNLRLLKVMLRCVYDGVTSIKPGHQTTGNSRVVWSDESSFTLFPSSGKVYLWRTPKETHNLRCLVLTVKHGDFYDGLGSNIVVFCWSHYCASYPNYCNGVRGQVG
jgi:hypothetical protein